MGSIGFKIYRSTFPRPSTSRHEPPCTPGWLILCASRCQSVRAASGLPAGRRHGIIDSLGIPDRCVRLCEAANHG
jgi:hypothetical protein